LVKSPFGPIFVIPAKAGIPPAEGATALAGVTAFPPFYEIIKDGRPISEWAEKTWIPGIYP
jgi:hypothetical protein